MPLIPDNPKSTIPLPNMHITTSFTSPQITVPAGTNEARIEIDGTAFPVDSSLNVHIQTSPDGIVPFVDRVIFLASAGVVSSAGIIFTPPTASGTKARASVVLTGSPVDLVGSVKLY